MVLGRHCDKPAAGEVEHELRRAREVALGQREEEVPRYRPPVGRRGWAREEDLAADRDAGQVRQDADLRGTIGKQPAMISEGEAHVWIGGFLPGRAEHLHRRHGAEAAQLDECDDQVWVALTGAMRCTERTFSSPSRAYMM